MEKVEDEDEDEDGLDEGMKAGSRHYLLADGRILGIKAVGISRGNSSNSRALGDGGIGRRNGLKIRR